MGTRRPTLASITTALLGYVPEEARRDLASEDPRTAVDLYFGPIGFQPLPSAAIGATPCATDGYYDSIVDPHQPWIIYATDVSDTRIRFTILHELGHHLLVTAAAVLLDDIDVMAGSSEGAIQAEEAICHRLAGHLLVSDDLLSSVIAGTTVTPEHVRDVHDRSSASWEAAAIRVAEAMPTAGAVVLLRDDATISLCAASPRLGWSWWPPGSELDPSGPLARALASRQTAIPETYRFGLGYARPLFCDTLPIHSGLAIAVLSEKPSDGSLSLLPEVEPAWKQRVQFCEWHPGVERDVGWCDKCKGRRCPECFRCGCTHPAPSKHCGGCGLLKPFRPGATLCRDCEADHA